MGIEFDLYAQNAVTVIETEDGGTKWRIDLDVPDSVIKRLTDKGVEPKDIKVKRMDLTVTYDADGNIEKIYYYVNVISGREYVTLSVSMSDFAEINILSVG